MLLIKSLKKSINKINTNQITTEIEINKKTEKEDENSRI